MRMRELPRILAQNWTLKFAALGLAILLWISVRVDSFNRHEVAGVPVEVELNDPRWAMLGEPMPMSVQVRFAGPFRELFRITWERPSLLIPIDEVVSPDTAILLRTQWVRIQDRPGVVVEDIFPSSVRLAFEPIQTVSVPLEPRVTGDPPDGMALASDVSGSPSIARISGPSSLLEQVDTIFTRSLDLSRVTESGTYPVPVDTSGMANLQIAPGSASISIRMEPVLERSFEDLPVMAEAPAVGSSDGAVPAELEFDPESVEVVLEGPESLVEAVEEGSLRVVARINDDIRELAPGEEGRVPLRVEGVPEFVEAHLEVDSLTVRLRRSP